MLCSLFWRKTDPPARPRARENIRLGFNPESIDRPAAGWNANPRPRRRRPRTHRVAVLVPEARLPRLNGNQQRLLAELASAGGRMPVSEYPGDLYYLAPRWVHWFAANWCAWKRFQPAMPLRSIQTAAQCNPDLPGSSVPVEAMLNHAQRETLLQIAASVHARKFQPFLLHGVTGSGRLLSTLPPCGGSRCRTVKPAAGPGDRTDSGHGGATGSSVWR